MIDPQRMNRLEMSWQRKRDELREQITDILNFTSAQHINLSVPRHTITTPVLRDFAYDQKFSGQAIPIVFRDGSKPSPFPIGRLERPTARNDFDELPSIRLGLISFRHTEMDYFLDSYLLPNIRIRPGMSFAEEEQLAFSETTQFFKDPVFHNGATIRVYHTGLEPVVVGFYRGVVESIILRVRSGLPRRLQIIPCFYVSESHNAPSESLTSDPVDSFIESKPWY